MNTTKWFSAKKKPAYKGWYQRRFPSDRYFNIETVWFNYWDGKDWYYSENHMATDNAIVIGERIPGSFCKDMLWRGLKERTSIPVKVSKKD